MAEPSWRLLERDYSRHHFGPSQLEDQWVELLQKQSLFPLEATLRNPSGAERFLNHVRAKAGSWI